MCVYSGGIYYNCWILCVPGHCFVCHLMCGIECSFHRGGERERKGETKWNRWHVPPLKSLVFVLNGIKNIWKWERCFDRICTHTRSNGDFQMRIWFPFCSSFFLISIRCFYIYTHTHLFLSLSLWMLVLFMFVWCWSHEEFLDLFSIRSRLRKSIFHFLCSLLFKSAFQIWHISEFGKLHGSKLEARERERDRV